MHTLHAITVSLLFCKIINTYFKNSFAVLEVGLCSPVQGIDIITILL